MTASPRQTAHAGGFTRALSGWGRFTTTRQRHLPQEQVWAGADGELVRGRHGGLELDLLTTDLTGLVVERTADHVAASSAVTGARHIVVVQIAGHSVLTPADQHRPVELGPGMVSYGDPTVPYRWEFLDAPQLLMVRMPAGALASTPPSTVRRLLGEPFAADDGFARLAVTMARQVLSDATVLTGPHPERSLHQVAEMFSTVLSDRLEHGSEDDDLAPPLFAAALDYIATHLHEPLTVDAVASQLRVSRRYLQGLFQDQGLTVTGWIRRSRLEASRNALADPDWDHLDLLQIAFHFGFADQSHFGRLFRAEYGETPSHWRSRQREARSSPTPPHVLRPQPLTDAGSR